MRAVALYLLVLAIHGHRVVAQSMADVFKDSCSVTWIGLDFSKAKLVPDTAFAEMGMDARSMLHKWNTLLEKETEKFDLGGALRNTRCTTNTSFLLDVNNAVTPGQLLGQENYALDKELVPGMVRAYPTTGEGLGVVFIVSTFDKARHTAEFYVTFFNMATKEVLLSDRVYGKPMGFGLRNYWAGAVYSALKKIKATHSRVWRNRYK